MVVIGKVTFIHCPRETNEVAHNMARFCFDSYTSCNRVDEPPSRSLGNLTDNVLYFKINKVTVVAFPQKKNMGVAYAKHEDVVTSR
jgi:hypothetical protein